MILNFCEAVMNLFMFVCVVLVIPVLVYLCIEGYQRQEEMFRKCMADGHKDYECYFILRGSGPR